MVTVRDVIAVLSQKDQDEEVWKMMPVPWPYRSEPVKREAGDTKVYLDEVFEQAMELVEIEMLNERE